MRIDLHTHSAYSDGTDTPAQLMQAAADVGLDMIGLTDHDTFEGWHEAAAAVHTTGVALMRGVEISCEMEGRTVHMLGYLVNPDAPQLPALFATTLHMRVARARIMVERLSHDYPITWDSVQAFAPMDGPIGRPHIADALVATGVIPNRSAAFEDILHPRSPYYERYTAPDAVTVVRDIVAAGGVAVYAHPRARKRQKVVDEHHIEAMRDAGLFGIERDHRDHSPADRAEVEAIATRLGLAVTGSSDYHGTGKPNRLGENVTSPAVAAQIEEMGYLEVLRP